MCASCFWSHGIPGLGRLKRSWRKNKKNNKTWWVTSLPKWKVWGAHMSWNMYLCMHRHTHTYIYIYVYVYVYVYIYIIHMNMNIYIYIFFINAYRCGCNKRHKRHYAHTCTYVFVCKLHTLHIWVWASSAPKCQAWCRPRSRRDPCPWAQSSWRGMRRRRRSEPKPMPRLWWGLGQIPAEKPAIL